MLKTRLKKHILWLHLPFIYKIYKILQQTYTKIGAYGDLDAEPKEEILMIIKFTLDHKEYSQIIPPLPNDLAYLTDEPSNKKKKPMTAA